MAVSTAGFFRSTLSATTTDAAEQRLRELYGDVELGGLGGYREHAAGDAAFTLAAVELDGSFDVHAETDVVTVAFSTPGYRWRVGRDEGDLSTAPAVFQPHEPMTSRITGRTLVTTVTFDVDALATLATALYGEPTPIRFDGQAAASAETGRLWSGLVTAIRRSALLEDDLSRATAHHSLAVTALESFRLVGDRHERSLSAEAGLRAYRRACGFIDEHLSLPITVADVAQAAGIGERELRQVFLAHSPMGWGPEEHLRRGRLAAAHRELLEGDPTLGDSVGRIAARWGFPHPGRFAAHYREVYRVNPRHVLDR
jgi:AraC-like DNA-binding protein